MTTEPCPCGCGCRCWGCVPPAAKYLTYPHAPQPGTELYTVLSRITTADARKQLAMFLLAADGLHAVLLTQADEDARQEKS